MKKILFYIDSLRAGGAQRVMSNLVSFFSERGYNVDLVNDYVDGTPHLVRYSVPDSVNRLFLRDNIEGNKYVKNIQRIIKLREIIKKEKPDVVLSFLEKPNKRMLFASIGLKTKKVVSVRNDPNKEYGTRKSDKAIVNALFRFADGVVFQTNEAKQYFHTSIQKKSSIIVNPIAKIFFDTNWIGDKKQIVSFGRLEKQKNHRLLIYSFSKIAKDFCDYNLIIYGEGPLRQDLEHYIMELGLSDRVFLPGNTSNVAEILSHSSLFVLSSDYEGMPNALMEAMAVGVPCVSTDCPCGGPKELLNNIPQLLAPCSDSDVLSDRMRSVLKSAEDSKNNSIRVKSIASKFYPDLVYNQWEQFLFGTSNER